MEDLIQAIRERRAVLFVGAGISMPLGLPSHSALIAKMANELGYDEDVFETFGDPLALAEYYSKREGTLGRLRSWMDVEWHGSEIDIGSSNVHQLIVELNFPIIYTTNYDRWLERAFDHQKKSYVKVVDVADIAKASASTDVTQIVKFHGDFDDDESIILTESSYFDRLELDSPLDIKLMHDTLGRSVLFIGYSLSDVNTRYLTYKLEKQWSRSKSSDGRPQSYIFLGKPNPVQELILRNRGISVLGSDEDDATIAVEKFLSTLAREAFGKT